MAAGTAGIACFGAAHIDRHARAPNAVVLGTSNPVAVSTALGGVARNVAESLARLGCPVALVSRVGGDVDGDRVVSMMTGLGVVMDGTGHSTEAATAGYTALVGPDGDLCVGMADMGVYDELTPAVLGPVLPRLEDHGIWFADCNLPSASLALLRDRKPSGTLLAIDAVSVAKSERLGDRFDGIDLLFGNRDEAAVLAGAAMPPFDMATAMRDRGAVAALVSLASEGVVLADANGCTALGAPTVTVRDVTGAGDGLVAGTLCGLSEGRPLADCVRLGIAAAALSLEDDRAVSDRLAAPTLLDRAGLQPLTAP